MSGKMLKHSLIGAGAGLAGAVLLLLLLGLILLQAENPDGPAAPGAQGVRLIGAAVGGFLAARLNREKGLLCGGTAGGFYSLVLLLAAAFTDGAFPVLRSLGGCLLCVGLSAGAGVLGLPGEKSGAARRRALMKRSGRS